mmetsp:Transcript_7606/g.22558  ORF Transcript_7606/g.22558 Transcript_7606/m.22558 type:complete len:107 (-) Transcript_7606:1155-1475(-)
MHPTPLQVIKRAMDLGTVLSRVKQGHYHQAHSFFEEVALVFSNAMVYNNNPSHPVVTRVYFSTFDMTGDTKVRFLWLQHTWMPFLNTSLIKSLILYLIKNQLTCKI